MKIHQNYNLSKLNTFGVDVNAKFFAEVQNEEDLRELFSLPEFKHNKKIFLGGGSNVLFTKDFDGMVILNKLSGVDIWNEDNDTVILRAMSGENWHALVEFVAGRGYWGIENLSLIPGTVGAAPMQNIGAYGREIKDVLENVEAYDIETGEKRIFSAEECRLGYRDSVFKNELKDKYFISAITLKLSKLEKKSINYVVLQDYLSKNNIEVTSPKDVSDAVSEIRRSKLPDPKVMGNAGSFFKNVFVTSEEFKKLQAKYPEIPYFEEEDRIKIPAGWLIERSGWKGKRIGNVGVHDKQALVLVNYGGATGQDLIALAGEVIASVKEKFGLELVPEVNIV